MELAAIESHCEPIITSVLLMICRRSSPMKGRSASLPSGDSQGVIAPGPGVAPHQGGQRGSEMPTTLLVDTTSGLHSLTSPHPTADSQSDEDIPDAPRGFERPVGRRMPAG